MANRATMKNLYFLLVLLTVPFLSYSQLPETYDLRDVDGVNYVTSIKSQQGGTCWTHGTYASMEGNMLITNAWADAGETGEPALAEYHLDWWNGFNQHNNDDTDPPSGGGLEVHMGGDYRVATAYFSRGEGAVREIDGQSYNNPPARHNDSYHYYYPRTVEWYTMPSNSIVNIDVIKQKIIDHGVMATCMCYDNSFINSSYIHYQPPTDLTDPNHSVAIIGWDDNLETQAALPGAWLCKNSWGTWWGNDGYFWISYYDKHACRNIEMGAISFQEVEPMQYEKVFYHDYHGWRDQVENVTLAANRFDLDDDYILEAVSFFSNAQDITYTATIFETMGSNGPENEIASMTGTIEHIGFHTYDFEQPVDLTGLTEFVIQLELSDGGMPYDRTSDIPVLLGASSRTIVDSYAEENQSFYYNPETSAWEDFYNYDDPSGFNNTGNFCIKGLGAESTVGINSYDIDNMQIFPNPAQNMATLTFTAGENGVANIVITDMSGRAVMSINANVASGMNSIPVEINNIEPGFYTIHAEQGSQIISRNKIIIK